MGSAIRLRDDFDGTALRQLARQSKSANQARCLLALAEIYDGGSRTSTARIGGVGLQIVRDWVVRFNAQGPEGLLDGKAPGRQSLLNDAQRRALVETVEHGPIPAIHGVVVIMDNLSSHKRASVRERIEAAGQNCASSRHTARTSIQSRRPSPGSKPCCAMRASEPSASCGTSSAPSSTSSSPTKAPTTSNHPAMNRNERKPL